jgi:hypothetical protein
VEGLCQEFAWKVESHPAQSNWTHKKRIIAFAHKNWVLPLEDRIRPWGWRIARIQNWSEFRILTLVDSYR